MTLRSDGRHVVSVTMNQELYHRLYSHCRENQMPVTVYIREILKRELPPDSKPQ